MGRPVEADGQPHPLAKPAILTRAKGWHEGLRVRHGVDKNSVKLYNEHNVQRAEMTMNNPAMFRVWRHPEGQASSGDKRRRPLRKGLADIPLRAQVAHDVNHRFMAQMATLGNDLPLRDLLKDITRSLTLQGRRIRALDITGKDREFLLSITDPQYTIWGITNQLDLTPKNGDSERSVFVVG